VTSSVRPAIVAVPVRCEVPVLAATLTVTVPPPERLFPPSKLSQETLLLRVHGQSLPVVTDTGTASPAAGDVRAVGEIV
jgi:hypothetical protein